MNRKSLLTKMRIQRRLGLDGTVYINDVPFSRLSVEHFVKGKLSLKAFTSLVKSNDNLKVVSAIEQLKGLKERNEWPLEILGPKR